MSGGRFSGRTSVTFVCVRTEVQWTCECDICLCQEGGSVDVRVTFVCVRKEVLQMYECDICLCQDGGSVDVRV